MPLYTQQVIAGSGRTVSRTVCDLSDDKAACRYARDTVRARVVPAQDSDQDDPSPDGSVTMVDAADRVVISVSTA